MPFDDPAALDLRVLFRDERMFDSRRAWEITGFRVFDRASDGKIMVASHPSAAGLLFKKYNNDMGHKDQLRNYERRVEGADRLRAFAARRGLRRVAVPRKWLLELPRASSRKEPSHVLAVEQFDLLSDEQTKEAYYRIDPNTLRELCEVLFRFRGMDSNAKNVPFLTDGRVAFIDTEHWDRGSSKSYLHHVGAHLSPDHRKFSKKIFDRLEDGPLDIRDMSGSGFGDEVTSDSSDAGFDEDTSSSSS